MIQMANEINVPVSEIVLDPRLQMRAEMNFNIIDEYADSLMDLPPGKIVMGEGGVMWLTDGWHTYHAHIKSKQDKMKCSVREGTFQDALKEAAGANHGHGIRRTAADKRRAVTALLSDALWRERSDRMIADTCHVSNHLVAEVRKTFESENGKPETTQKDEKTTTGNSPSSKRTGKDGKQRSSTREKEPEKQQQTEGKKPILCKRCARVGAVKDCQQCAEARQAKKPEPEKKKPKSGKPIFDDRTITDMIGKLARSFDIRAGVYGKGPKHLTCMAALDKLLAAFHQWQVA
jgi:hypothetical protein